MRDRTRVYANVAVFVTGVPLCNVSGMWSLLHLPLPWSLCAFALSMAVLTGISIRYAQFLESNEFKRWRMS